ncbi:MAG: nicotinate phosphoribosyltransferase [Phycisphaerae bacterium]
MRYIPDFYKPSLALLTDLYQLTMAQGYWKQGVDAQKEASFALTFRKIPFEGGYAVTCGQSLAWQFVEQLSFDNSDLEYLSSLEGNDGKALFEREFIKLLSGLELSVDICAMPEGTVAFAHEPIVRVTGPILQCQLLETPLLNMINFQTLLATKAARVAWAAGQSPVLEFGLRRAQGIDGGISASRASYVGGCAGTSNVLAGKLFDIPIKGTHAHSWVMSFDSEIESFEAYAQAMPNNCVFLVDTYDSLEGTQRAVQVARDLREKGHEMVGIRLDSGDLAYLSIEARKILDTGGFEEAKIVASGDLDEYLIRSLIDQGAKIDVYGVGTKLATAYDQPALGGVYKLAAVRGDANQPWQRKVKLSEQRAKMTNPGLMQVRRFSRPGQGEYLADAIYDSQLDLPTDQVVIVDPLDETRRKVVGPGARGEDLLIPVFQAGRAVAELDDDVQAARDRARRQLDRFHETIKRFENPHQYPVGLEQQLYQCKTRLIFEARGLGDTEEKSD